MTKKRKTETLSKEEWQRTLNEVYRTRSEVSLSVFLDGLTIDGARGPEVFGPAMVDFQTETFDALSPSLEAVARGDGPRRRRFWIERTKKAGKDSDLAACLLWLLAFPKRPIYMQVGAADRDQAGIVKKRMESLLYYNPWLAERVNIRQWKAKSIDGLAELDIMAADIAGAHGGTPDVLVVNELSHVTKWEFVQNLLDNADGVPQGIVIIATNAGHIGTKAHSLKLAVEGSDLWSRFYWSRPAPWANPDDVEEARRRGPKSRYERLWKGRWVSGKGDALDEDAIARVFRLTGPTREPEPGWRYIAGLDLGVSHDHAALVVLGVYEKEQRIRVAWFRSWEPPESGEIDLPDVENVVRQASGLYRLEWIGYDPYQAKLMSQRLKKAGVPMREVTFTGKNLKDMADGLKQAIDQGRLESYDDLDGRLRNDLGKLTIEEKPYGYRLAAVSDETGHADVATALVIALPRALGMLDVGDRLLPDDVLATTERATKEDIDSMPDELREIYELGREGPAGGLDDEELEAKAKERERRARRRRRRKLPTIWGGVDGNF